MTLQATNIERKFKYNGMTLNDPAPGKDVQQVRKFYAMRYPELLNAEIQGPVTKDGVSTFTFVRATGSKG